MIRSDASTAATQPAILRYVALVPAAGTGSRMQGDPGSVPKQYQPLLGRPMLWHTVAALRAVARVERVYVVLAADDGHWQDAQFADLADKLCVLRCGGATRALTVRNGLRALCDALGATDEPDALDTLRVLVHDAARPCVSVALIERLLQEVGESQAGGLLAVPLADTLKRGSDSALPQVLATVPRDGLWQAQTPQLFPWRLLLEALDFAPQVTDEASAIETLGLHPRLVASDAQNLKVTYPPDLALAGLILRARGTSS